MDYKQKVAYLKQYQYCRINLESLLEEREKWFTLGTKVNSVSDGMPHATSDESKVETSSIKIVELTEKINAEIANLDKTMAAVEKVIEDIPNFKGQTIFKLRYINGMSFSKIADMMGVSERNVFQVHKRIIQKLEIENDKGTMGEDS